MPFKRAISCINDKFLCFTNYPCALSVDYKFCLQLTIKEKAKNYLMFQLCIRFHAMLSSNILSEVNTETFAWTLSFDDIY